MDAVIDRDKERERERERERRLHQTSQFPETVPVSVWAGAIIASQAHTEITD